jgi:hypothetical protein
MKLAQTIMLAAPSVAMAVVGAAWFGPGAARSYQVARVWGGPTEGMHRLSFRVAVMRRYRGIDSIVTGKSIEVRASAGAVPSAAGRCVTGADGICDVELRLETPARGPVELVVGSAGGNEPALARGPVTGSLARWIERPPRGPEINGARGGDLEIHLYALRGVLAAPFPEPLALSVAGRGGEVRGQAQVTVSLVGGDIAAAGTPTSSTASGTTDERGRSRWTAIPRAHAVEVNAEAKWQGLEGRFAGVIPVVPGALWLDPQRRAGQLRVVSPVPRTRAYATLASRSARLWGATIPLENDEQGFASGTFPWPDAALPSDELVWLVLSGDPEGTGVGTVGWPLTRDGDTEPMAEQGFADTLLLDGMPAAEQREGDRRRRAAWLVAVALGATAGLEAALVLSTARAQGSGAWGRVMAAVAAIVLAFAAIGIVAMWKATG